MTHPLSLIPVNLKESALDSPTFRANAIHFCEQVEAIEKWLDGYIRSMLKVCHDIGMLEDALTASFSNSIPAGVSESIVDPDYTLLALQLFAEAGKDFWSIAIAYSKRIQPQIIDPITDFLRNDVRSFKDCRRAFESSQQRYDLLLQRYAGQSKGKEASALREDAFQLHESRKTYIRSSFDFCVKAPELRAGLDRVLTRATTDLWREQVQYRKGFVLSLDHYENKMDRIRSWSDAMDSSSKIFKQELALARKEMEEQARSVSKPSRELDDYSTSTVPFLTTRGKETAGISSVKDIEALHEKQGWLFVRSATGKQGTRSIWIRRWCFVKDGMFGSLVLQGQGQRGAGVEETEKIGLLLCNVKPAFQEDRRFCFEIKTKDASVLLQAETQQELTTWLHVFEAAKRAALVSSTSTNSLSMPAFAISPPNAEFASAQTLRLEDTDKSTGLAISGIDQPARGSVDISKRNLGVTDESSRLGQILDLPTRRSTTMVAGQSNMTDRKTSSGGGIHALISASHGALPLNPVPATTPRVPNPSTPATQGHPKGGGFAETAVSALAPRTLVNLPMSTNLSKQAVAVSATSEQSAIVPGGLMANSWGTSNWGLSPRPEDSSSKGLDDRLEQTPALGLDIGQKPLPSGAIHRKAISLDLDTQSTQNALPSDISIKPNNYPSNYPDELLQQDAQFRIIFSEVGRDEIVLLVFRATWKPNDAQEFPGRAFITSSAMYFYSHYLGLVLVNKIPLRFITDVKATQGKHFDLLHLHLKEVEELGPLSDEDIAVTTFLEPIWLLQRRLRYLVEATTCTPLPSSFDIIRTLTKMENEPQQSPTSDSWEEISLGEGVEDLIPKTLQPSSTGTMRRLVEKVTRLELGEGNAYRAHATDPINFVPPSDAIKAFDGTYSLSAKSLFCLIFGGKSRVFLDFYSKRRSSGVTCTEWTRSTEFIGDRKFYYRNGHRTSPSQDRQVIHAWEDNRYYMVVDRKSPWMLPSSQSMVLELSVIIAQVSKQSSSLSIWIANKWSKEQRFWKDALQSQALQILRDDAQDLASLISHEISKVGSGAKLFKVTGEYGQVVLKDPSEVPEAAEIAPFAPPISLISRMTYWSLFVQDCVTLFGQCMGLLIRGFQNVFSWAYNYLVLNWFLLIILAISIILNMNVSFRTARDIWQNVSALNYIERIGVVPAKVMSRSLTLDELELAMSFQVPHPHANSNQCFQKFLGVHALRENHKYEDPEGSKFGGHNNLPESLQMARRKLGIYRHDMLVTLSLINRLEKNILMSEWDAWIWRENLRCFQAMAALRNSTSFGDEEQKQKIGVIDSYCRSCEVDVHWE